jgi:hypothetical protein
MALHCISCGAVYADVWPTDVTIRIQPPVCPHCNSTWQEDTDRSITGPTRKSWHVYIAQPAVQTVADRQVAHMKWLEEHGITHDATLYHQGRSAAIRESKGLKVNLRKLLQQAREEQYRRDKTDTVPLLADDVPLHEEGIDDAENEVVLILLCDDTWAEYANTTGLTWQQAMDLAWKDYNNTEAGRQYYKAVSMQLSRFRKRLVEKLHK